MQLRLNLFVATLLNCTSQNKETVQTVLILGFFLLLPMGLVMYSLPLGNFLYLNREPLTPSPLVPALIAIIPMIFPSSQTFTSSPDSPPGQLRLPTLVSTSLPGVLSHQSPLANPTVQPNGT